MWLDSWLIVDKEDEYIVSCVVDSMPIKLDFTCDIKCIFAFFGVLIAFLICMKRIMLSSRNFSWLGITHGNYV